MNKHADCLFCKIVAKTDPSVHVHEDDVCMAFMDIHPLGKGHVLVIPKDHAQKLDELDATQRMHLYSVCDRIVAAQRRAGLGVNGSHLLLNDGKAANQHVPHVHFHLIPRSGSDSLGFFFRVFLHFTGLFGLRTPARTLQVQAELIRGRLESPPESPVRTGTI